MFLHHGNLFNCYHIYYLSIEMKINDTLQLFKYHLPFHYTIVFQKQLIGKTASVMSSHERGNSNKVLDFDH